MVWCTDICYSGNVQPSHDGDNDDDDDDCCAFAIVSYKYMKQQVVSQLDTSTLTTFAIRDAVRNICWLVDSKSQLLPQLI